jgi:hypothetical protein
MDRYFSYPDVRKYLDRQNEETTTANAGSYVVPLGGMLRPPFFAAPADLDAAYEMPFEDYIRTRGF